MTGKLRVNGIGRGQQRLRAGQVRHVGVVLVGEHRVVRQAQLLRALDFRIPVGSLDQAAHQAQPVFAGEGDDVLNQFERAGLIGLHRQPKTLPLRVVLRHPGGKRFKHIERELQPVHFLGVNREVDVGPGRQLAQTPDARHQLGHHAFALRVFVARVKCAELDGYTIILLGSPRLV